MIQKLPALVALTRLDRPIGIYLLMWPMLWAFWFAAQGFPHLPTLAIFIAGTILTRSAGCAINDYADRNFDAHVKRTQNRPLATGVLSANDALMTTGVLMLLAFVLVLFTNMLTVKLSLLAVLLSLAYPFTKRYTHFPQVVLGAAFACAIPMAYAAQTNSVPFPAWCLFIIAILWTTAYDTLYAMADRRDDLKIGIKSTAILFGSWDLPIVAFLQFLVIGLLCLLGLYYDRGILYFAGLVVATGFVVFQLYITRHRAPDACLQAFLNNHWLGMSVFVALLLDYLVKP